jgi:hypothetical protein
MANEASSPTNPPAAPRGRFQYSLSTLMLLTTIAALLCAVFAMYRELKQARADRQAALAEVKKFRGEMGYLDITDRTKACARALRQAAEHRWSWRVYLPDKRKFTLTAATKWIPEKGLPGMSMYHAEMLPGEHFVDASANEGRDGKWRLYANIDGDFCASPGIEMTPLVGWCAPDPIQREQRTVEPGQPMVLLRLLQASPMQARGTATADGIMIWIEEEKPGK